MTNEEREKHIRIANVLIGAINDLIRPILMYQIEKDVTREALENYIKMLEQQPCEDCISREELINELKLGYFNKDLQEGKNDPCVIDAMINWAIRAVKRQPSVTPEPFINKPCISEGVCHEDKIQVLNKIRAEIDKARFIDKDTRICKNALASGLEVAMQIIDKYMTESNKEGEE